MNQPESTDVADFLQEAASSSSSMREGLDIAVIGMAGRFPGARTLDDFWQNLCEGRESITFFTDEELLEGGVPPEVVQNPAYVKAASLLDEVEWFDANFFGMPPREAEMTDPQHRLLLECAWQALEDAGYTPESHNGNIGVFAGASTSRYVFHVISNAESRQKIDEQKISIGTNLFSLSTRVSYKLDLHGPSLNVQTACSTSLVATHLACQSLLSYQCDAALVGAVSVKVPQREGYFFQPDGIVSPDGHCRAFDAKAQGTIFGSGVGVLVLKRLEDAIADRDTIHAVIKGSALNNDGAGKVSYTAPGIDGQTDVIMTAHAITGVSPETITYIEAHGTGTAMGDPIEVTALTQAFRSATEKTQFCALGSVKSNIGHLDATAGMAGMIKTILMLKHKLLVPSLYCQQPTPSIAWAESPFYVNTALRPWPEGSTPRRAGVSAFGFGGTNAHLILEEAQVGPADSKARPYQVLTLSARTQEALEQLTHNIQAVLEQPTSLSLADIAFTLQTGRRAFQYRRVAIGCSKEELASRLAELNPRNVFTNSSAESSNRPVIFLFPGQGSQYVNMARGLYEQGEVFKEIVDSCAEMLLVDLHLDLRTILYPSEEQHEQAEKLLGETYLTQPALFVVEYALAQQLLAWGIKPQAMLGHSIGEYVAACIAGVFSLESALKIVALRGRLAQETPVGAMLSVPLSEVEIRPLLNGTLALAAVNAPQQCVVAGSEAAIADLEQRLSAQHIVGRRLPMVRAFHSPMMDSAMSKLEDAFTQIPLATPTIPFLSNVTGTWISVEEAKRPHYWAKQLRQTVLFASGLQQLLRDPHRVFLEVGPTQSLDKLVRQQAPEEQRVILTTLRHSYEQLHDEEKLSMTLGCLWAAGVQVSWSAYHAETQCRRVPLPTYPFERQFYWIEPGNMAQEFSSPYLTVGKRKELETWFYVPGWKQADIPRNPTSVPLTPQTWLLFVDKEGIGEQVATDLRALQQQVVVVYQGEAFAQQNEMTFTVAPQAKDDFLSLMAALKSQGLLPHKLVHMWSVTASDPAISEATRFALAQERGLYSLLVLLQAVGSLIWGMAVSLYIVTSQLYEVIGNETLRHEQAPIQAIRLTVGQEYPGISCQGIDIPGCTEENRALLGKQILEEMLTPGNAMQVAYRAMHRWVETFEAMPQPEAAAFSLRTEGVYLITGGLGQMGLLLAKELVQHFHARVALVDKRSLSMPELGSTRAQVEALLQAGAEVRVFTADVTDKVEMQKVVEFLLRRWGAINGVIYAAGVSEDLKSLAEARPEDFAGEFAPRVHGLLILEEVLRGCQLDFCLLLSSLSSLLGGIGHVTYTAANLFLDAFAQSHNQRSTSRWTSVNWETWNLRDEHEKQGAVGAQRLQLAMDSSETLSTFYRVIDMTRASRVIISSGDLNARMSQWIKPLKDRNSARSSARSRSNVSRERPTLQSSYEAPRNADEQQIVQIYSDLLGIEQIGIHDSFFELGGDSLLSVQLIAQLRESFQQELSLRSFFESPTPAALATLLSTASDIIIDDDVERILEEVESLTPEEVQALLAESTATEEGSKFYE